MVYVDGIPRPAPDILSMWVNLETNLPCSEFHEVKAPRKFGIPHPRTGILGLPLEDRLYKAYTKIGNLWKMKVWLWYFHADGILRQDLETLGPGRPGPALGMEFRWWDKTDFEVMS